MTRMLNDKVYEERKGYIFIDNVVFVIVYIIPVTLYVNFCLAALKKTLLSFTHIAVTHLAEKISKFISRFTMFGKGTSRHVKACNGTPRHTKARH